MHKLKTLLGPEGLTSPKIAGFCGLLAPVAAFALIALASALAPWFSWTEMCLSDLAGDVGERPIYSATGAPAIVFNAALILCGALGVLFGMGFSRTDEMKNPAGRVGAVVFIFGMVALAFIGIFPLTLGLLHSIVSRVFFFLVPIALVMIGAALKGRSMPLAVFSMVLGVVAVVGYPIWALYDIGSCALMELLSAACMAVFAAVFGWRMVAGEGGEE